MSQSIQAPLYLIDPITPSKMAKLSVDNLTGVIPFDFPLAATRLAGTGIAQTFSAKQTFDAGGGESVRIMDFAELQETGVSYVVSLAPSPSLSADRTQYFPNGAGTLALASNTSGQILLDDIANPDGDKTFNMTTRTLKFLWTAPSGNPLELEASGAYSGSLLHVHQHTGNPGASHLVMLEAEDTDVELLHLVGAAATTHGIEFWVSGDSEDRLRILTDGKMEWGTGSAAADTNLYRSAANTLKTDDAFQAAGGISSTNITGGTLTGVTLDNDASGTTLVRDGANFYIKNTTDDTKSLRWDCSTLTTSTSLPVSVPDINQGAGGSGAQYMCLSQQPLALSGQTAAIGWTTHNGTVRPGLFVVGVYLTITTAGSAGTITVYINNTDALGSYTQTPISAVSAASTGRHSWVGLQRVASGGMSYNVTFTGVTGSPVYNLDISWIKTS